MQESSGYDLTVHVNPLRIALVMGSIVIGVAAAHALVHLWNYLLGGTGEMSHWSQFFDMGSESNLPTYVSVVNLFVAGVLLALIARYESRRQRKQSWHWWGLAVGFVLMSLDEDAMIHERVGLSLTEYFGRGDGVMYYNWYKLYVPILLLVGLLYLPFLRRLPSRYRLRFLLAGILYVGGSIGFEMLESYLVSHGLGGISVSRLFEETGEMLGVVVLIHTLLLYLADHEVDLHLRVQRSSDSPRATVGRRVVPPSRA